VIVIIFIKYVNLKLVMIVSVIRMVVMMVITKRD